MSGGQSRTGGRKPRPIPKPDIPPGPLAELKDLLYRLYTEAGMPAADVIAAAAAADEQLPGAPSGDTVRRVIGGAAVPPRQPDVVAVAVVLARMARWNAQDVAARVRDAWVAARMQERAPRSVTASGQACLVGVRRPPGCRHLDTWIWQDLFGEVQRHGKAVPLLAGVSR